MKAIIEVARRGSAAHRARAKLASSRQGRAPDFRLSFESARCLFADLTPARLDLLDTLRKVGPCSVYALAKEAARNYSNVHTEVSRLAELGLIERDEGHGISVPFDAMELLFRTMSWHSWGGSPKPRSSIGTSGPRASQA